MMQCPYRIVGMMSSFCNRFQPPAQMIEWYQAVALNVDG
jgi:hypothetical protein